MNSRKPDIDDIARKTVSDSAAKSLALIKWIRAKFESKCGQCRNAIHIGDDLGQPTARNRSGGNRFASTWYCEKCARVAAVQSCLGSAPFLGRREEKDALDRALRQRVEEEERK